jgi:hypothetical protein
VPKPDVAIYYGKVSISNAGNVQTQGGIDDAVRNFYDEFVPIKRSGLIEGRIKLEPDEGGTQ